MGRAPGAALHRTAMNTALAPIFRKYERLAAETDAVFRHVADQYPGCVTCRQGCSDCCHAVFDLSLVEAMYINSVFQARFPHGRERSQILERASVSDRRLTRVKREMFQAEKNGASAGQIMRKASGLRMACPLLNADNVCLLYDARPVTCRLYGIPLEIGGESHVCGFSAFDRGKTYPTVQLGKIQARLEDLSREIASAVKSRFELHDVYVPLSMALLTSYDDKYLGIGEPDRDD